MIGSLRNSYKSIIYEISRRLINRVFRLFFFTSEKLLCRHIDYYLYTVNLPSFLSISKPFFAKKNLPENTLRHQPNINGV